MTVAVCPYCRGPVDPSEGNQLLCAGCGTPHHADCYAENGGCTVFGCSAGPAEEPKLSLSGSDLANALPANLPPVSASGGTVTMAGSPAVPEPPKVPPPPPPPGAAAATKESWPRPTVGSVLFSVQPVPVQTASAAAVDFDLTPHPNAKNRTTFIVLGVLLGIFGAHNFYAGYRGKAVAQLSISLLTLGFATPMTWAWAVIDVCTVDRDQQGIKFKS